jgi:hypothetical protein
MSIEDIHYLKNNSIKQTCVILIDSKNRDLNIFPNPNEYIVFFNVPFKNVIGFDIIDSSIPRTMYSVDIYNNSLFIYIHPTKNYDTFNNIIQNLDNNNNKDPTFNNLFTEIKIKPGDYTLQLFIEEFNHSIINFLDNIFPNNSISTDTDNKKVLEINALSDPTEMTDMIEFICTHPFIINMGDSTIAETLGFYLLTKKELNNINYTYNQLYKKLYISFTYPEPPIDIKPNYNDKKPNYIISPGMVCFTGEKYILMRSKEIEEHSFGSLAYTNNNLGIAKFRTNSLGFNDEKLYITKIPIREFHPIGKLSQLSIRFETADRKLYDFKGVNHNITLAIYYYEPSFKQNINFNSILNPNYNTNFNNYKYTNDEQEIINEDDDDEDDLDDDINENFSRDNINIYKKMEQKYNY